ncbi:MAG TPA: AbrB/MazE/SpoVT family DNA-binding domain-containing protein [Prosthecobacter sp.]
MKATLTLGKNGRLAIPSAVRKKPQLSAGAKLCLEVVEDQIVLAEQVPEAEITWHKDGRPVVTGWTGFDAAKAVREMRADQVAKLDAPFRR